MMIIYFFIGFISFSAWWIGNLITPIQESASVIDIFKTMIIGLFSIIISFVVCYIIYFISQIKIAKCELKKEEK